MESTQVTTVSFFSFDNIRHKFWAFSQMGAGATHLKKVPDLEVFKLMGTGAGQGFSALPDFSTYCLLAIWKNQEAAIRFFTENVYAKSWKSRAVYHATLGLQTTKVRGSWDGNSPFELYPRKDNSEKIVVLTRATIAVSKVLEFWKFVPSTSRAIQSAEGVLFMKGVGELPWFQQATVSVWENMQAMRTFAYQNVSHKIAIQKTNSRKWYTEELFAEFQIVWYNDAHNILPFIASEIPVMPFE